MKRCPTCGTQYRSPDVKTCGSCFLSTGDDVELVPMTREVRAPLSSEVAELPAHTLGGGQMRKGLPEGTGTGRS